MQNFSSKNHLQFARILMLLENKGDLQYRFPTKFCLEIVLYLTTKKKTLELGYYRDVYSYSRIGSIEQTL